MSTRPAVIKGEGFNSHGGGFSALYIDGCRHEPDAVRRAVNNHYPLLSALQELAHVARSYIAHMDADDIAALDRARAALASAQPAKGGRDD